MVRARGCTVWDGDGNAYLDTTMALGAVGLGYGYPAVVDAAHAAAGDGIVGALAPALEQEVAERLVSRIPGGEAVRFLKTGAEAVAAAVRIARVYTGRDVVITCGYHGWLDWCQDGAGVPRSVIDLRRVVPFNDGPALRQAVDEAGPPAAIVIEPVVDEWPDAAWLADARTLATQTGSVLVFDEIKTAFRVAVGGVAERLGITPDVAVLGKALGNGFPISAVVGSADVMQAATRTWISSTLATEFVSLAAARAVMEVYEDEDVASHLETAGRRLFSGLERLAQEHHSLIDAVRGIPQMCYLSFNNDEIGKRVASAAAENGVLFKRDAYNFACFAHTEPVLDQILERLGDALVQTERAC